MYPHIYPSCTGLSPSTVDLPRSFHSLYISFWAPPLSLATTYGITIVLFSSGYLDVSVLRVFSRLTAGYRSSTCRVAPFGHLWINARLQLPIAFRSLPRPSSSLRAKASTIRPYLLPILIYFSALLSRDNNTTSLFLSLLVSLLSFFSPNLSKNFCLIYKIISDRSTILFYLAFGLYLKSYPSILTFNHFCGG